MLEESAKDGLAKGLNLAFEQAAREYIGPLVDEARDQITARLEDCHTIEKCVELSEGKITEYGLREHVRHNNGELKEQGIIARSGRVYLVNLPRYINWLFERQAD